MKYVLALIVGLSVLIPSSARADVVSYEESWDFLYEFNLEWDGAQLVPPGDYIVAGGDPTVPLEGSWEVVIYNSQGLGLSSYRFEPSALNAAGHVIVRVPHEFSGTDARFFNPAGQSVLRIDLRGSRTCNDDGYCDSRYGEERGNCPADCSGGISTAGTLSASVAGNLPTDRDLGFWLLKLSYGAAGVLLLVGAAHVLDSHRRP